MINSRSHRFFVFLLFAAICGVASLGIAEKPPVVAAGPSESKKPQAARAKPQVIYHLPPASNYAAALHSQAKTQRDTLPVDSNMPASLQMANGAANDAAASAKPEHVAPPRQVTESAKSRPPRMAKPQVGVPHHVKPAKQKGPGKPHGNKGHHK